MRLSRIVCAVALMTSGPFIAQAVAQTDAPVKVVAVKGLMGVKNKSKGTLVVESGTLNFNHANAKTDVPAKSIDDVITGNDSERLIHGTMGTLSMFAPYGSGRFLSLFRTKLDTVTVKYRDADGGLHGAIFTMPVGQADVIKKKLVAQGARTTVAPEAANAAPAKTQAVAADAKEKQ